MGYDEIISFAAFDGLLIHFMYSDGQEACCSIWEQRDRAGRKTYTVIRTTLKLFLKYRLNKQLKTRMVTVECDEKMDVVAFDFGRSVPVAEFHAERFQPTLPITLSGRFLPLNPN